MDGVWARGGDAGTKPAGVLGVAAGHKRGCFLVPYPDIADFVLTYTDGFDQRPDSIAHHSEDDRDAPGDQRFDNDISCGPVWSMVDGFGWGSIAAASWAVLALAATA